MEIRSVYVVANIDKPDASEYLALITAELQSLGISVQSFAYRGTPMEPRVPQVDLALVLGGDGTVLFASRLLHGQNIPLLAINLGTVGFIAEVVREEWKEVFQKYKNGELGISQRLMIQIRVIRQGLTVHSCRGLNDCVVSGATASRMVYLDVQLSGVYLGQYRADGMIVATPTGSTAYSLSAGGPILHPETDALILTPICPHSLSNRPLVLPGTEKIVISLNQDQRIPVTLTVDGQEVFPLQENDRVEISRLPDKALFVKSDKRSFYEVVCAKLN